MAVFLGIGTPFLPHSPRWLHHVGRHAEARTAWEKLGVSATDVEKTEQAMQREQNTRGSFTAELKAMWQKSVRGRTALGVFIFAAQNACGIDGVLYVRVLSSLFRDALLNRPACSMHLFSSRKLVCQEPKRPSSLPA